MAVNARKVAIIGCGFVGSATAFALMQSGLFSEIVMLDADMAKAEGEALDISHGVPFSMPCEIHAGDYDDIADSAIIIVTAGAAQKPGETRLELIKKNVGIFKSIIPEIAKRNFKGILLIVANPVDVLTYAAKQLSGLPDSRVFGSGTVLDSARLRFNLSEHIGVDPRSIHAFIIGEHGDTELPVFSSANISGIDLDHFCNNRCQQCSNQDLNRLFESTRDAAYRIIDAKGSTYYAIAEATRRIATAILRDESAILPISVAADRVYGLEGLSLSLPCIVGQRGVERVLEIPLSEEEMRRLQQSAARMRSVLEGLDLVQEV